jgi:hypothetical protein
MIKKLQLKKRPSYVTKLYINNPGLSGSGKPTLIKQDGERIVAQSELAQLQEKRDRLQDTLHELDSQILALKTKRKDELLAELEALGLDGVPVSRVKASTGEGGRKKGRPRGFTMSEAQKQAMREGRQKAKAARRAGNSDPAPSVS